MKNLFRLLVIGIIVLLNLLPMTVSAATSVVVVITATPVGVQPPTPFTVTVVSNTELQLDWGYPVGTVVAMIRAKYGFPPATMADGYLVYTGAGITATDNSVDLENNTGTIYYAAWGQNALGVWSFDKNNTLQEATGVIFAAFLLGAVALSGFTFRKEEPEPILSFLSGAVWFMWGAYCFTVMSTAVSDLYYWAGWFGMLGGLASGMLGAFAEKRRRGSKEYIDEGADNEKYYGESSQGTRGKQQVHQVEISGGDMPSDSEIEAPSGPSARTSELHSRARSRKTGLFRKKERWGEFK